MSNEFETPRESHPRRRAVITVVLSAIAVIAVFLLDILSVPIVVLIAFFLGFAASDHAKRDRGGGRLSG